MKLRFESLDGELERRKHNSGAVDENVQPVVGRGKLSDEGFDGLEGEQVHGNEVNVFVGAFLADGRFQVGVVGAPTGNYHFGFPLSQVDRHLIWYIDSDWVIDSVPWKFGHAILTLFLPVRASVYL